MGKINQLRNIFQFHKGTIKTVLQFKFTKPFHHFNSIKVRLKPSTGVGAYLDIKFQFHKGTIKTIPPEIGAAAISAFQFHKGTIKTQSSVGKIIAVPHFNSIKVRLKRVNDTYQLYICVDFNSIKVRLKRFLSITHTCLILFQFHKGTIKTY